MFALCCFELIRDLAFVECRHDDKFLEPSRDTKRGGSSPERRYVIFFQPHAICMVGMRGVWAVDETLRHLGGDQVLLAAISVTLTRA